MLWQPLTKMVNSVLSNLISENLVYYNLNLKVFKIRKKPCIRVNTRELNCYNSKTLGLVNGKNLV